MLRVRNIMVFLVLSGLFGCEQEIDNPIAEQCLPVVHCLLDIDDSIHYVRLGKTFSGPNLNQTLQNPDSLYYKSASVYFDYYRDGQRVSSIELQKTDSLQRDPGIFPQTPFILYYTKDKIYPGTIMVRIESQEEDAYAIGACGVRGHPIFILPNPQ